MLPFIRQDFNLDYLQSGFIVSAFALCSGLSQFLGGWLSDKLNYRRAMILGLGGVGLSGVATSLTHSYFTIIATLILMGVMAGFYHPSGISALTNQFDASRRGRVVALHMVGGSLGFGIGPLLAAIIANALNWHFAYMIISIPAMVASLMVFFRVKTPARSSGLKP